MNTVFTALARALAALGGLLARSLKLVVNVTLLNIDVHREHNEQRIQSPNVLLEAPKRQQTLAEDTARSDD